jgi:hypothetical protein
VVRTGRQDLLNAKCSDGPPHTKTLGLRPLPPTDFENCMTHTRKGYSICGKPFKLNEFSYGKREGRSYCQQCSKAEKQAYARGGIEAARAYREAMRAKWKR